ncbi:MAG: hypothetical protein ABF379_12970 [Akkermansiaceae bacterium]|jgi:hypothetical protein
MKSFAIIWVLSLSLLSAQDPFKVGNFTFTPGKSWIVSESKSHMVKATLNHGKKNGPLLKFYHFGEGQGGGVEANIQRWKKQFENGEAKVTPEEKTFGDQKLTIVTMTGTYMVGPMMQRDKTATPGYMLLGAIIAHPSGDVFLKMLGKEVDVKETKADFEKLVSSAFEIAK